MSATLRVRGPAQLAGRVRPPPDKSIAHRALIFAALGEGESQIAPYAPGRDVAATAAALGALGVSMGREPDGSLRVQGAGTPRDWPGGEGLRLDCANSGTTMRLLAGLLAARPGEVELDGDASLRARPMERLRPLETMGAQLLGDRPLRAPFRVRGARLRAADVELSVASAQVKSALLLAGLFADGPTRVVEPGSSRDHTERWLADLGVQVETGGDPERREVTVRPVEAAWPGRRFVVPPDPSSAAFFVAAALVTKSDGVEIECGANPSRMGFFDVVQAMGVDLRPRPLAAVGPEPRVELRPAPGELQAVEIAGRDSLRALDELPIALGLAAFARGRTELRDAAELRVKESDRLEAMAAVLGAFGIVVELREDGATVHGGRPRAAEVDARGDHRIAMTAAVMGLGCRGTTVIRGADAIGVSYPGFDRDLAALGADVAWG